MGLFIDDSRSLWFWIIVLCVEGKKRFMPFLQFNKGCEDDDSGGDNLCNMLAALPHLLHSGELQQGHIQAALHPAGLFGYLLVGHEFHYVQPHHLLLSKPKVNAPYNLHLL